jgi:serine/threonine protein kinase
LKPKNLVIAMDMTVKIADFGIATKKPEEMEAAFGTPS